MNLHSYIVPCLLISAIATFAASGNQTYTNTPPDCQPTDNKQDGNLKALFEINQTSLSADNPGLLKVKQVFDAFFAQGETVDSVTISGSASIDGPLPYNDKLARQRAEMIGNYLIDDCNVPKSRIVVKSTGENWPLFLKLIDNCLSEDQIAQINALLSAGYGVDQIERKLRVLDNGSVWQILKKKVFSEMRVVKVDVDTAKGTHAVITIGDSNDVVESTIVESTPEPENAVLVEEAAEVVELVSTPSEPEPEPQPESEIVPPSVTADPYHWYLKTNLPAWALLVSNIQAEMDVASHFSVMLPIYYSGWNYFRSNLKLRLFTVLPEARYWLKSENQGLFFGVHAGFSYYNYATPGELRYQDRDGHHPAYGGGLTVGYRLPIRKTSPWQFEFSAGYGIYHLDYDKFQNSPNGLLVGHNKRMFYGIDNVAVTLSYRFNMTRKRKGGDK